MSERIGPITVTEPRETCRECACFELASMYCLHKAWSGRKYEGRPIGPTDTTPSWCPVWEEKG